MSCDKGIGISHW